MGLFGNDKSFSSQPDNGATGGIVPYGFKGYGASPAGDYKSYVGQESDGIQRQVSATTLNDLLGQGRDVNGAATNWMDPNSFSHQNLGLILNNQDSLNAGNTGPFAQQAFQQQFLNNPNTVASDPSAYLYNQDPNFAANQQQALQAQAMAASQRAAPQLQTGAVNMFNGMAGQGITNAQGSNLFSAQDAQSLEGAATGAGYQGQLAAAGGLLAGASGAGYQGQLGAAQQLQQLGQAPAGPSVAQQQLLMGADTSMQQQMAMAAGARGGNAALALQNAGQNQGTAMGQLNQSQALLRAQEDMANKQFSANAISGAGSMYGQAANTQGSALGNAAQAFGGAAGTQTNAYGSAGQLFGQQASNQLGQANTMAGIAQNYGQLATAQGQLQNQTTAQNDQTMLQSQQLGQQYLSSQLQATSNYDQNRTQNQANILTNQYANRDKSGQGTITGSGGGDKALMGTVGVVAALSDVRAKKNIKPADGDVSDAFRAAADSVTAMQQPTLYPTLPASAPSAAPDIRNPFPGGAQRPPLDVALRDPYPQFPSAPAYAYEYKDPNQPGAKPGVSYGPMAQDLESTPAGASVVGEKDGKKYVDAGRLSMLTAAEVAKQRTQLDALFAQGGAMRATPIAYPQPAQPSYLYGAP